MEDRTGSANDGPDAAELAEAIDEFRIGPVHDAPRPVRRAWSNKVWQVHGESGESFAIKLFPHGLSGARRQQLQAGVELERNVFERQIVAMPRPVTAADGWVIELRTPHPRLARCHAWVDGQPAETPLSAAAIQDAGAYLGRLHALNLPGGDTAQLAPLDMQRWSRAVHLAQQTGLGWADQLADLTPLVETLAADLQQLRTERRPMQRSHRDYDPKNALINTDGQLVITDWDYAGPVLPDVELIVGATSFADSDADIERFVQAYREAGGNADIADTLAMTAESADLDWLLRNVESSITSSSTDAYTTAATLIASLPHDVKTNRSWPKRLAHLLP